MRKNKRTPKELEELRKEVIQYYFNNPHANSSKYMQEKFKTTEKIIRDILSAELQRRLDNSITRRMLSV
jgi:predicted AAA+ superfamily ATPase